MARPAAFFDFALALFSGWAPVSLKRMFGGAGLYREGRMFGLIADDQIYLKVNDQTRDQFAAAGSRPFIFTGKSGKGIAMSYFSLPDAALDDAETLRQWADLAWRAAQAGAAAEPKARALSLNDLPLKPSPRTRRAVKKP